MIEVRYMGPLIDPPSRYFAEDDIDEIVATNAEVHLELLDDNTVMLIVHDDERLIHTTIFHEGRVPIRVRMKEDWKSETLRPSERGCACRNSGSHDNGRALDQKED